MKTFFLISGIVLMLSGTAQVFVRPRGEKETLAARLINRATIRAVLFILAGLAAVLLGSGVFPLPLPPQPPR